MYKHTLTAIGGALLLLASGAAQAGDGKAHQGAKSDLQIAQSGSGAGGTSGSGAGSTSTGNAASGTSNPSSSPSTDNTGTTQSPGSAQNTGRTGGSNADSSSGTGSVTGAGRDSTTPGSATTGATTGGSTTGSATTGGATGGTQLGFTQNLKGKDVVNANGDTIGEVEAVQGDKLIVSVGGFLGIGARNVALDRSQVTVTGAGDDAKIVSSMSKDELKAMPEYRNAAPAGTTGTGNGGSGTMRGTTGSGSTTR